MKHRYYVIAYIVLVTIALICLSFARHAGAYNSDDGEENDDKGGYILEGDPRDACEALLCLRGGGKNYKECDPALKRYYSIKKKKLKNTIKARKNFLKLCPGADSNPEMIAAIELVTQDLEQCEVARLNARGRWIEAEDVFRSQMCTSYIQQLPPLNEKHVQVSYTYSPANNSDYGDYCLRQIRFWEVSPEPPNVCKALWADPYMGANAPRLVKGQYPWDTRWVE